MKTSEVEPRKGGRSSNPRHLTHYPEYFIWYAMIRRCENKKAHGYYRYGGRGIGVCEQWRESFWKFFSDMGPRPNGGTIERKNNDNGYSPDNCIWASRKEQQNNQSANHLVSWCGETKTVTQWAEEIGVSANTMIYRLRRGWPIEYVFSTDISKRTGPKTEQRAQQAANSREARKSLCKMCGSVFYPRANVVRDGNGKYCSLRCSSANARNVHWPRHDPDAGKPFRKGDYQMIDFVRAIIIADPWIGKILSGEKTWEMRSTPTKIRGRVGLIRKGSGLIVGSVEITDVLHPLDRRAAMVTKNLHKVSDIELLEKWKYPWVLKNVVKFKTPIPYNHPRGAVVWVKLRPPASA